MNYRIGLDLGIASIGWAIIEHDEKEEAKRIVNLGVRVFDKAEMPKNGDSLAGERRAKRSLRRVIRRKAHRVERTKFLLLNTLIKKEDLEDIYNLKTNVYDLRFKALQEKIDNLEFSKILIHFVKHRGFKSNRKSEESTAEGGKLIKAVKKNKEIMEKYGYRTIGEMIYKCPDFFTFDDNKNKVYLTRNKEDDYSKTFYRVEIEEEIKTIFKTQRELGNIHASENLERVYLKIFNSQRSFDMGPGGNSPYKIDGFEVGKCTFEKKEYRASKNTYTFEYFDALCRINNLKIKSSTGLRELILEEKKEIIKYIKENKELTFKKLRDLIKLGEEKQFSYLKYDENKLAKDIEKKKFIDMSTSYAIRKILFGEVKTSQINDLLIDIIDKIATIWSLYKEDEKRKEVLLKQIEKNKVNITISNEKIEKLLELNPKKFGNLSLKAMKKVTPYLEQGLTYDKACKLAGYEHNIILLEGNKEIKLKGEVLKEILKEVNVPVVRRAVSQALKVLNAIINKYGSPQLIHVEVAREVSKSFNERRDIEKQNEDNQARNERIKNIIKTEFGILDPSGTDIIKYRLREEQQGKCAYSQKEISANILFSNATQIDHIIPFSRSLDDSYNNKVLVLAKENQDKGNKIPYEYIGQNEARWNEFVKFVTVTIKSSRKKMNLLKEKFTEEDEKEWKEKNLNDTKYISRYILNVLQQKLKFAESEKYFKKPVVAVSGKITSYLRKVWGLSKIRENGDLHHSLDATVIAMATDSSIQKITNFLKYKNNAYKNQKAEDELYAFSNGQIIDKITGEVKKFIPKPYEHFDKELQYRIEFSDNNSENDLMKQELYKYGYTNEHLDDIKPIFVSRMPKRGMKGSIHDDTIRSAKFINNNKTVVKTALSNLKLSEDKQDIKGYPEQFKKDDRLLYTALVKRLKEFDGNAKEAFKNPFKKPKRDGSDGPIVKKVKLEETNNSYVSLKKMSGVANKGSMIRIDIFTKNNKNYIVPVYTSDYYNGVTPNKAIVANKKQEDWLEMTNEYKFKFSLYPNDLIYVKNFNKDISLTSSHKENKETLIRKEFMLYYVGCDINTNRIDVINSDNSFSGRISPLSFESFEKYSVDVMGNYYKVKEEKRQMLEKYN